MENREREKIVFSNHEEDVSSIEKKLSSTYIQQSSTKVFVEAYLKDKFFQGLEVKDQEKSLLRI